MPKTNRRLQLRCPNCDRVMAILPEGYQVTEPLVCPNCGSVLDPPSPLRRFIGRLLAR